MGTSFSTVVSEARIRALLASASHNRIQPLLERALLALGRLDSITDKGARPAASCP
jgi:hypothetical protein